MDDNTRATLIGFHTFTGNDYALSFFKRGKQACSKVMKQCNESINVFRLLGEDWELNAEVIVALDSFACHLCRYKDTDINKLRKEMFDKKFLLGRKSHGSVIPTTLPVHISAHLALELCRKELEILFTQ